MMRKRVSALPAIGRRGTMALRDRLMLASCSVHLWGNRRKDSTVKSEVATLKHVKKGDAGDWKTNLLAGADEEYEALKSALNLCRSYHYKVTLSWGKRGEQVLPSALFLDYSSNMMSYRAMADQRLEDLCAVWDTRVGEAQLNSPDLTSNYRYPTERELRAKCGVTIEINPMHEAGDLILDIEDEEAQKLLKEQRDRMTTLAEERVKGAMDDLWQRFQKLLVNAKRNLDLDVGQGRFRTEWHENLTEFVALADKLNFTKDENLEKLVQESADLLKDEADVYKEEADTREEGAAKVQENLDKMKDFYA
jgi:hypothetical protein